MTSRYDRTALRLAEIDVLELSGSSFRYGWAGKAYRCASDAKNISMQIIKFWYATASSPAAMFCDQSKVGLVEGKKS